MDLPLYTVFGLPGGSLRCQGILGLAIHYQTSLIKVRTLQTAQTNITEEICLPY